MISVLQSTGASIRVTQPTPGQVVITSEPIPRGTAGTPVSQEEKDHAFNETASTTVWSDYHVTGGTLEDDLLLVNHTPGIASLDSGGIATWAADGLCKISVTRGSVSKTIFLNCYKTTGATLKEFTGYVAASIADITADAVLSRATVAATTAPYYSAINHAGVLYTKSATCWAADLDLSCVPVATDIITAGFGPENRGALVTARHAVLAAHYAAASVVGKKLRFRSPVGTIYEKTITGQAAFSDLLVVTLNSAVDASITPMPIVGDWWMRDRVQVSSSSESGYYAGLACFIDQSHSVRFLIAGTYGTYLTHSLLPATINGTSYLAPITANAISRHTMTQGGTPNFLSGKTDFYQEGVAGDSGSPVFLILNDAPALLWTWWNPTSGVPVWTDGLLNDLIAAADASAGVSAGLTVTVAPDPTL